MELSKALSFARSDPSKSNRQANDAWRGIEAMFAHHAPTGR